MTVSGLYHVTEEQIPVARVYVMSTPVARTEICSPLRRTTIQFFIFLPSCFVLEAAVWTFVLPAVGTTLALVSHGHKHQTGNFYVVHRETGRVTLVAGHRPIAVRLVGAITALLTAREGCNAGSGKKRHVELLRTCESSSCLLLPDTSFA